MIAKDAPRGLDAQEKKYRFTRQETATLVIYCGIVAGGGAQEFRSSNNETY